MEPAAAAEHHAEPAEHEEEVEEAAEGAAVADGPPAKKQRGDKVQQAQRRLDKVDLNLSVLEATVDAAVLEA